MSNLDVQSAHSSKPLLNLRGVANALSPTLATTRPPCAKAASLPGMPGGLVYFSVGTDSSSYGATLPGETILEKAVARPVQPWALGEAHAGTRRGCRGTGPAPGPASPAPPCHQQTALLQG